MQARTQRNTTPFRGVTERTTGTLTTSGSKWPLATKAFGQIGIRVEGSFSLVTFFLSQQKESYPPAGRDRRGAGTARKASTKAQSAAARSRSYGTLRESSQSLARRRSLQ